MLTPLLYRNNIFNKLIHFIRVCKNSKFQYTASASNKNMSSKPPNILVFTGNDCSKLFKIIENNLLNCLSIHSYLVYHLLQSEVKKQLWIENTELLVVACDEMDESIIASFESYMYNSGKLLCICSNIHNIFKAKCNTEIANKGKLIQIHFNGIGEAFVYRGQYYYNFINSTALCFDRYNTPVIHKTFFDNGILIASEIYLDRDPDMLVECPSQKYDRDKRLMILKDILVRQFGLKAKNIVSCIPPLSPGYFITNKGSANLEINCDQNSNAYAEKPIFRELTLLETGSPKKLLIYYADTTSSKPFKFDTKLYFSCLNTYVFGHNVVYFPIISSTMDVVKHFEDYNGIVIVASCQSSGKGRGGNKWISPVGCAMFTLCFNLPLFSKLGQKLSFIQHIASLSVVHGIRNQEQYKKLNIQLKWPNDIYFDNCKIGGILVTSTIQSNLAQINVGWGINVANDQPMVCLNSVIDKYNLENLTTLPYLSIEEVIAATVSQMEYFVEDFKKSGPDNFLFQYYHYWMHNLQKIKLSHLNESGTIIGLDDFGFLVVKTERGKEISLQPDGNRFDIMRNMIYLKEK